MIKPNKRRERLLYMLNVPWDWIEQRPQILARGLSHYYEVECFEPRSLRRALSFAHGSQDSPLMHPRWIAPDRLAGSPIDSVLQRKNRLIAKELLESVDTAWLSYPDQVDLLPKDYHGWVVYDCMDDHHAMAGAARAEKVAAQERRLLQRADLVIASSKRLIDRIDHPNKVLVRNGFKAEMLRPIANPVHLPRHKIGYFGTIAEWFDFQSLEHVHREIPDVSFKLIGPAERGFDQSGFECVGSVPHERLYSAVEDCSCLIMPFTVNETVKAVDPVKLYEYMALGKCVISCQYDEINRFGDYVYFYRDKYELKSLIDYLISAGFPPKYNAQSRDEFLQKNSWDSRMHVIIDALEHKD